MNALIAFAVLCVASTQAALTWEQCGSTDALKIDNIAIGSDKVTIPGELKVNLKASVLKEVVVPTKVTLKLVKNGLTLPCIPLGDMHLGSCTYDDVCETLKRIPDDCKSNGILGTILADAGLPCRCPLPVNEINISGAKVTLDPVPSYIKFLAEGRIDIEAKAFNGGSEIACVQLSVDVHFP